MSKGSLLSIPCIIFRLLLCAMCISATHPSIRPYPERRHPVYSLDSLHTLPNGSSRPAFTFSFILHYTLFYRVGCCGCTLSVAWSSHSYEHEVCQISPEYDDMIIQGLKEAMN